MLKKYFQLVFRKVNNFSVIFFRGQFESVCLYTCFFIYLIMSVHPSPNCLTFNCGSTIQLNLVLLSSFDPSFRSFFFDPSFSILFFYFFFCLFLDPSFSILLFDLFLNIFLILLLKFLQFFFDFFFNPSFRSFSNFF